MSCWNTYFLFYSFDYFFIALPILKDCQSIVSAFSKYFSNIGSKLANEIPPVDTDPQIFLGPSLVNSFVLLPVTTTEVEDVITSLQSAKASDPYSIPVCLLKLIKTCISFPLQLIYNLSLSSGCVPDHFKLANSIPLWLAWTTMGVYKTTT